MQLLFIFYMWSSKLIKYYCIFFDLFKLIAYGCEMKYCYLGKFYFYSEVSCFGRGTSSSYGVLFSKIVFVSFRLKVATGHFRYFNLIGKRNHETNVSVSTDSCLCLKSFVFACTNCSLYSYYHREEASQVSRALIFTF